jgi:hypothetical protein
MLIDNGDGTYTAGPLDVMFIYHHVGAGTYHPAFYEERPMPGPVAPHDELEFVRLFSKMHHTQGAPTLEEAQQLLVEMRGKIKVDDLNVESETPIPWSGELGDVMLVLNWRKKGAETAFSPHLAPLISVSL